MPFPRLLATLLLLIHACFALAGDHILQRSVLEDKDHLLQISQLASAHFEPINDMLSAGYSDSAFWVRLVVRPLPDHGQLFLRIRPSHLDNVTLYAPDPAHAGQWLRRDTGDRLPYWQRDFPTSSLGFIIKPDSVSTYYLRLTTSSTSLLQVLALPLGEATRYDTLLGTVDWLYLGVMLWMLLWALGDYLVARQALTRDFIIAQFTYLLLSLPIMGLLAPLLPTATFLDPLTSTLAILATLTSLYFHRHLLVLHQAPPRLRWLLDALMLLSAMGMPCLLAGHARLGLELNAIASLLAAPVFLLLAFRCHIQNLHTRRVLRVAYALLTCSLLLNKVPVMGMPYGMFFALYGNLLHGLVGAGLMLFLLHARSRQLRLQGINASMELELAMQRLQMEQERTQERQDFMSMLTHELKNSLAVLRISLDAMATHGPREQRMQRALCNMNAILERCQQVHLLEYAGLPVQLMPLATHSWLENCIAVTSQPQQLRLSTSTLPEHIQADEQLVTIMLSNLLDNALKYAASGSMVDVCASGQQDGITITVSNLPGNAGLPDPDRLFEKYYRSPHAQSKSGSGLGLYLVRSIADRVGADIDYLFSDQKVHFTLWIPA